MACWLLHAKLCLAERVQPGERRGKNAMDFGELQRLLTSELKYRTLFGAVPNALILFESDSKRILDANAAALELYGYNKAEILQLKYGDVSSEPAMAEKDAATALDTGKRTPTLRRHRKRDGSEFVTEVVVFPIKLKRQTLLCASSRRHSRQHEIVPKSLGEQGARLNALSRLIQAGILLVDEQSYEIVDANPVATEMIGLSYEQIVGRRCQQFLCSFENDECPAGDLGDSVHRGKKKLLNVSGDYIPVLVSIGRVTVDGRKCVLESFVNISDKEVPEEELLRTRMYDAIGLLANRIANDFNAMLSVILGHLSITKLETDEKVRENLTNIEQMVRQTRSVTQQLLAFTKGGAPVKCVMELPELTRETVASVLQDSNCICRFLFSDDLHPVHADPNQLEQVVRNLLLNSQEAMPDGGVIEMSAWNETVRQDGAGPLKAGEYVRLRIKDEGPGIPSENLERLFDPYFSTKRKGLGLGLAAAYQIIQKHGGLIRAASRLGEGAVFNVYIPAAPVSSPVVRSRPRLKMGAGRVLVMEDQVRVSRVLKRMLAKLGYEATLTKDGEAMLSAYEHSQKSGQPFNAVIVDLIIPGGLGGKEAIRRLLKLDPKAKAIVSSGCLDEPELSDHESHGFRGILSKPYMIEELSEVLHELIVGKS